MESVKKNAAYALEVINEMDRDCKSRAARKRMAELALEMGRYDDEARAVWVEYLASF